MPEMSKQMAPLSVRITPQLKARLEESAARIKTPKHTLAILAIEAAVEAIEKNDYMLVVPIKFKVENVPTTVAATTESSDEEVEAELKERQARDKKLVAEAEEKIFQQELKKVSSASPLSAPAASHTESLPGSGQHGTPGVSPVPKQPAHPKIPKRNPRAQKGSKHK